MFAMALALVEWRTSAGWWARRCRSCSGWRSWPGPWCSPTRSRAPSTTSSPASTTTPTPTSGPTSTVEIELRAPSQRGRMPGSVVATVAGVDGVADAAGLRRGLRPDRRRRRRRHRQPRTGRADLRHELRGGDARSLGAHRRQRRAGTRRGRRSTRAAPTWAISRSATRSPCSPRPGRTSSCSSGTAPFGSVDSPGGRRRRSWTWRPRRRCSSAARTRSTPSSSPPTTGVDEEELTARSPRSLPDGSEAITGTAGHRGDPGRDARGPGFFNDLPARVRRRRPRRGVLHDLQHVPDHRHPAHPGDGAAAVRRRHAGAGPPGPAAGSGHHRPARVRHRAGRRRRRRRRR